jgi:hypothetical protein
MKFSAETFHKIDSGFSPEGWRGKRGCRRRSSRRARARPSGRCAASRGRQCRADAAPDVATASAETESAVDVIKN